jgi:heterodisulfide reductase subunit D
MDNLKELRRVTGAALCVECGKCSSMCPLAPFGDFSAARTMSMHDPAIEIHNYSAAVERCLTCASCETRCPQGVRYTQYVRGLRAEVPTEQRRPRPHGEAFQMAARLTRLGEKPGRPAWLEDDLLIAEEGEVALFVGCLPIFDVLFREEFQVETLDIARAAIRLLNQVGVAPVLVGDECCCGHDLLWGGERETFEALAIENAKQFQSRGVQHIVTVCAECCRTWRLDYPAVVSDYSPRVEHMTEFLAPLVGKHELGFRPNGNGAVTYQDPCRLGRQLGVYREPRELLAAVPDGELREMERSGQDALCCGTPGFIHCDAVSRQLQVQRLQGAVDTGASRLLTSCPKCLLHFRCAQAEDRLRARPARDIEVEDIMVYLAGLLTPTADPAEKIEGEASQTGDQV